MPPADKTTPALIVQCPHCKDDVEWKESSSFRPFCSERCQQIDLGSWASEEYAIPCKEPSDWQNSIPDSFDAQFDS